MNGICWCSIMGNIGQITKENNGKKPDFDAEILLLLC